jgi:acyl carrier protein
MIDQTAVFEEIRSMVTKLRDMYGLDKVEITPGSLFHDDLGLDSVDLVALGAMLAERYGAPVTIAEFLAELRIDDVIGLRIGTLVDYVCGTLVAKAGSTA